MTAPTPEPPDAPCADQGPLASLAASTPALVTVVEELGRKYQTGRRVQITMAVLTVALAVGCVFNLYLLAQVRHTQDQANAVRQRVLCPLYTLLLAAAEAPPPPGEGEDPRRGQALGVVQKGYDYLGCAGITLLPPPGAVPKG